jgi:hypothetical protein
VFQSGINGNHRYCSAKSLLGETKLTTEWIGNKRKYDSVPFMWAIMEEARMPVFIMWAVPAVIVLGGDSYYFIRVVH